MVSKLHDIAYLTNRHVNIVHDLVVWEAKYQVTAYQQLIVAVPVTAERSGT